MQPSAPSSPEDGASSSPPTVGAVGAVGTGLAPTAVGLRVDVRSAVPPYEQIRAQIAAHIDAGRLRHGDRLPSLRALAADLGVAAGTTARAYRELEAGGLVTSRRRAGTVVSVPTSSPAPGQDPGAETRASAPGVLEAAAELARRARGAGWSEAAVLAATREAIRVAASGSNTARASVTPASRQPHVLPTS